MVYMVVEKRKRRISVRFDFDSYLFSGLRLTRGKNWVVLRLDGEQKNVNTRNRLFTQQSLVCLPTPYDEERPTHPYVTAAAAAAVVHYNILRRTHINVALFESRKEKKNQIPSQHLMKLCTRPKPDCVLRIISFSQNSLYYDSHCCTI